MGGEHTKDRSDDEVVKEYPVAEVAKDRPARSRIPRERSSRGFLVPIRLVQCSSSAHGSSPGCTVFLC
jgi:hypothetical protein